MSKSQFNIKLSSDLLIRIKRQATMSGKSLTEHITDLINNSLSENISENSAPENKIKSLEDRILILESIVSNREYLSKKLEPFTNKEAVNCTKFMRGLFDKELDKRNFVDKKNAFDDFLNHFDDNSNLSDFFIQRLKEIMLSDNPTPFSGSELNQISEDKKCNCPIRKGLICWTGKIDCPSQQEICDKGEKLLFLI